MGDWKGLKLDPGQPLELYNLKADPAESQNVARAHQDIVERIEIYLATARTESTIWPLKPSSKGRDAKSREKAQPPARL